MTARIVALLIGAIGALGGLWLGLEIVRPAELGILPGTVRILGITTSLGGVIAFSIARLVEHRAAERQRLVELFAADEQ